MAKKKVPRAKTRASVKRAPAKTKSVVKKRTVRKKSVKTAAARPTSPAKRAAQRKTAATATNTVSRSAAGKRKSALSKRPPALGRPKVPGTAELDQMFHKDYEARQVFAFLGVKTVKELEEHPPDEIIERLTGPMVRAVNRIRKALALNNRYLAGDQKFAAEFARQIR